MTTIAEKLNDIRALIAVYEAALAQTRQSKDYAELRENYGSTEREAAFQALRRTSEYHQVCYAYRLKRKLEQQYSASLHAQGDQQ